MGKFYREIAIMFHRQMLLLGQSPDALVTAIMIPMILMLVFVLIFGGAMNVGDYSYVNFVTFAVMIQATVQASGLSAVSAHQDMKQGMIERFRSMPVSRLAFLLSHVLAGVVRNAIAVLGMLLVALLLGFRSSAGVVQWLGIAGLMLLFMTALSWVATFISVATKSAESAAGVPALLALLTFVSSGFAPVETLPGWLQGFARRQPLTVIIDTLRGLAFGADIGLLWVGALAWCLGLIVAFQMASLLLFYKKLAV